MILNCPNCSTQYFADDASIGETGRTVRCAACNTSWFAKPELSLEAQLDASDLTRERVERERQAFDISPHIALREKGLSRRQTSARIAAGIAWSLSAICFFSLGVGAVQYRDEVVRIWPQASSAYAMVGLDVNQFGLDFLGVTADRSFDGTNPILTIRGESLNVTQEYQKTPVVRVDLRDEHGAHLKSVYVKMDSPTLEPGGTAKFSARVEHPPVEAFDLEVTYIDPATHDFMVQPVRESIKVEDHAEAETEIAENDAGHGNHADHSSTESDSEETVDEHHAQ